MYVAVLVCRTTRYRESTALKSLEAVKIAEILLKHIQRYGAIDTLTTDNATNFKNALMRTICSRANIGKIYSTSYYPRSNGMVESCMSSLNIGLYGLCKNNKNTWDIFLPALDAASNTSIHPALRCSPHELMYGYRYVPVLEKSLGIPEEPLRDDWEDYVTEFFQNLHKIRTMAVENDKEYALEMKRRHDLSAKNHIFKEGQLVMEIVPKVEGKTKPKVEGPILLIKGHGVYFDTRHIVTNEERKINVNRMIPFHERDNSFDVGTAQKLDNEDPIYEIDLPKARLTWPDNIKIPETIQEETTQETDDSHNNVQSVVGNEVHDVRRYFPS
jgi:hypothetical protein